jgi:CRP-like cAMP-binding protein
MKRVGRLCSTLLAPEGLRNALSDIGETREYPFGYVLFRESEPTVGVFLIRKGKVRLRLPEAPHLDRVFGPGALLGLPATFTRSSYSLTATCVADCEILGAASEKFLAMMAARADLCHEATKLLCHEVKFILSAFRNLCNPTKRPPYRSHPKKAMANLGPSRSPR